MKLVFFETPLFTKILPEYLNDQDYRALQLALLENPNMGDLMPGTGGFRKVRWQALDAAKAREAGLESFIIIYRKIIKFGSSPFMIKMRPLI